MSPQATDQTAAGLARVELVLRIWEALAAEDGTSEACSGCGWSQLFKPALQSILGVHFDAAEHESRKRDIIDRLQAADPAGGHGIDGHIFDAAAALLPYTSVRRDLRRLRLEERLAKDAKKKGHAA